MTYRLGWGYTVVMWATALFFAFVGSMAALGAGSDRGMERVGAVIGGGALAALSAAIAMRLRRSRITIDAAGIEMVDLGKPRRLLLEQIRGYRVLRVAAGTYLVFEQRDSGAKKLMVPLVGADDAFMSWLARVPELDAGDGVSLKSKPPPR